MKYFNGKVECIEEKVGKTTKGKIYEVKDGWFIFDDGSPAPSQYKSIKDLNDNVISQFKLVIEEPQPGTKTWLMELIKETVVYVELRSGDFRIVLANGFSHFGSATGFNGYNENLTRKTFVNSHCEDVVKVYKTDWLVLNNLKDREGLELLWQREEDIELQEIVDWLMQNGEVCVSKVNENIDGITFFEATISNGYTIDYTEGKNTLQFQKSGCEYGIGVFQTNKELFEKVKELVNEDIDPIEIKEWLEEFTGKKINFFTKTLITPKEGVKWLYDINSYQLCTAWLYLNDWCKERTFKVFETHKEALQWLKDNLVKPNSLKHEVAEFKERFNKELDQLLERIEK